MIVLFLTKLEEGIIFGILIKPIIDTSWDVSFGGIRVVEAFTVLYLIFALQYCYKNKLFALNDKMLTLFWVIAHFGIIFQFLQSPPEAIKSIMKMVYLPISFVLLPYLLLYSEVETQKKVIKYVLIGALFSALISIFQFIGFIPYEFEHMTKGLQRSNGFYHDMVTSRINIMQGLLGLVYLKVTNILNVKPWVIWALLLIFVFSGYTLFSKALIGMFLVGLILLITTLKQETKNYAIGFFIFIAFLVTNFETVVNSTSTLFLTELEYQDGNFDNSGQLFSGRGSVWEEYLAMYSSLSTIEKTFGMGINSGNTHNEFLRVLMLTGILGLIGYTLFVFRIIYLAITNFHRKKVLLLTTFSLSMLIIDILGVVWGLYPFYLVIILGFFSVAINYESDSEEEFELDEDYEESYDGEYEVAN